MRSRLAVAIAFALVSSVAFARVASADPAAVPPRTDLTPKDGETALWWSLGATTLSVSTLLYASRAASGTPSTALQVIGVAGLAGLATGPAAGHIYAGEYGHAAVTTALRGGSIFAVLVGVSRMLTTSECAGPCPPDDRKRNGGIMALAGTGVFLVSTVYDVIDAPFAARRRNRARGTVVRPMTAAAIDASGAWTPTVGLSGAW